MDSAAYLKRQGWRGQGHSLDHTDRGIKKPLLVSKKVDVLGVGLNKHAAVSDQWWLRAFDQGLKDLGTGKQSLLANVQKHGVNRGGLYGRFVKGEGMAGSIGASGVSTVDSTPVGVLTPAVVEGESVRKMEVFGGSESKAGKKRKREEKVEKKSSRRKTESADDAGQAVLPTLESAKAIMEVEQKRLEGIRRKVDAIITEAQRLGILSAESGDRRSKLNDPTAESDVWLTEDVMARVVVKAGVAHKQSSGASKYEREKVGRQLKKAAKAYLLESEPPSEQGKEAERVVKEERKVRREEKKAKKVNEEAELKASEVEHAARKKARALARKERKARKAAGEDPGDTGQGQAHNVVSDDLAGDADEVKLGVSETGGQKRIPGVGTVDRIPTKAEKRSEKMQALAAGEAQLPVTDVAKVSASKLAEYTKRAEEKGVTLEDYVRRRDEKYAAKQAEKLTAQDQPTVDEAEGGATEPTAASSEPATTHLITSDTQAAGLTFIVDTVGDDSLLTLRTNDPDFSVRATSAISENKPFTALDAQGNEAFTWQPNQPIPLEPSIWSTLPPESLPKPVRKARNDWMNARRAEKKTRKAVAEKKAKAPHKVEAREAFVNQLLLESRKAAEGISSGKPVVIAGIKEVPLVKVTAEGGRAFNKDEQASARRVARTMMKGAKKGKREGKGKKKGV